MSLRDELIKIVLDKFLFGLIAAGVSLYAARHLERYKRDQAMTLELGRARAQAFVKTYGILMAVLIMVSEYTSYGTGSPIPVPLRLTPEDLLRKAKEYREDLWGTAGLLGPGPRDRIRELSALLTEIGRHATAGTLASAGIGPRVDAAIAEIEIHAWVDTEPSSRSRNFRRLDRFPVVDRSPTGKQARAVAICDVTC
jgi:hypothetical protein